MGNEKSKKIGGRPPKDANEKLSCSINLKLTAGDYDTICKRASRVSLTATQYARMMTLKGVIKSRFSVEELDLMRKIAGVANNVNQMAKRLNQSLSQYAIQACGVVSELKKLIDDSKKH